MTSEPPGREQRADLLEDAVGPPDVLEHVGRQHHVERALDLRREAEVEVGLDEAVDPLLHALVGDEVDAGDVVAGVAEALGQHAVGAPEVEDPPGRPVAQPADDACRASCPGPSLSS